MSMMRNIFIPFYLLVLTILLGSCKSTPAVVPTPTNFPIHSPTVFPHKTPQTYTPTSSPPTSTPTLTASPVPTISPTPSVPPSAAPTATITLTPSALPLFTTKLIRPGVELQSYLTDVCEYLRLRWSPEGSLPGTVVVPVMFHSIRGDGKPVGEGNTTDITSEQFQSFVRYAKQSGFETITTVQLNDFLRNNARIPSHSLLMIVDDRHAGTVEDFFLPILEENDWTVTLGWIIGDTNDALCGRMERLNATGRLDVQSHGYNHRYITDQTPEDETRQEIFDPIPILEQHFGQQPVAFIWRGGNFTTRSVQLAHEAGYQLGFTAFSRGPLMFNWIPQGAEEQAVGDPLMTIPHFWSPDLTVSLDVGIKISEAARAEAAQRYPQEADYYRTYCGGELLSLNPEAP